MKARASLVALAIALVVLAVILYRLDWPAVLATWARVIWPWVVAAAVVNIADSWAQGLRWRAVLGGSDIKVDASNAFWAMLVGTVGNVVLPFKLGEAARAWAVARLAKAPITTVASTVVLDRLVDLAALVILLMVIPPIVGPVVGVRLPGLRALGFVVGGAFLVVGAAVAWWRRLRRRRRSSGAGEFGPRIESFVRGLNALRQHHILAQAIGLAICSWCIRVMVVWTMLHAFGIDWPVMRAAMILLIINISIAVVATPGNVGTFELATAGALRLLGATPEVAMSFAVILHLAEVAPTALLGAFAIWKFGFTLRRPDR